MIDGAKKKMLGFAKYPIALAIVCWVFSRADGERIIGLATAMSPWWLVAGFLAFGVAQLFAVKRMNAYYDHAEKPIGFGYSLRLHYVALFYNIVLPGGIGGDGYKVYQLHRRAHYPVKEGIKIQILTRLNGLLVLGLTLCTTFALLPGVLPYQPALALGGAALGVGAYVALMRHLFNASLPMEWRALPWSAGVQGFNVLCMLALWQGLGHHGDVLAAIFLFQAAAVAGMLPITIGGLGVRELTFFYGASLLGGMDAEAGVAVSLLVFGTTLAHALIGLVWMGNMNNRSHSHGCA